ncbi:hypothetical protein [Myxococcus sp. RHSTA-1-4]|uniref:hypothetical protein n=1 Tax=Myxococcus sp. RHSTA-1-4 TaxID=2874601 RepID=UPI001CBB8606|nr:hypothetical protein [Myxococcus sp. RHSTA-1-4]MBZ4421950.1 hypothetical protein [Myxococcus sp. RHSTA-1-4]
MARDSMQPWLDRISFGEIEVTGVSPRSAFGKREWDGHDWYGSPLNQDIPALVAPAFSQVQGDPTEGAMNDDDFDFTIASY